MAMSVAPRVFVCVLVRLRIASFWSSLKLLSGRMPNDALEPAVVLGQNAAEVLHKKVGDPIQLEARSSPL